MRIALKPTDRAGRKLQLVLSDGLGERREICNIAVGDGVGFLLRRITGQVSGRTAAGPRSMVNPDHGAQHRLSLAGEIVGKTDPGFEVNPVMSEVPIPSDSIWIFRQPESVERVGSRDKGANQRSGQQLRSRGNSSTHQQARIYCALIGRGTSNRSRRNTAGLSDAVGHIKKGL